MRRSPFLAAAAGLVLVVAACGGVGSDGVAGREVLDEWAGFRRLPPPDVSQVVFMDHAVDPPNPEFRPVAPPGGLLLVYFGYLSCPDVCPTTLADLGNALELMEPEQAARIEVAMVSIDPERDTGPEIAKYMDIFVDRYHALLAPDDEALGRAAETFGVQYEIAEHEPGAIDYEVGHTATVFVVDDEGKVVWEFGFGTPRHDLAEALSGILGTAYQ